MHFSGANYRHFWDGQVAREVASPVPDGIRASRPDSGCGARLSALMSKAGMSFAFLGIMLVTPPSIKDSDCYWRRQAPLGADYCSAGRKPWGKQPSPRPALRPALRDTPLPPARRPEALLGRRAGGRGVGGEGRCLNPRLGRELRYGAPSELNS